MLGKAVRSGFLVAMIACISGFAVAQNRIEEKAQFDAARADMARAKAYWVDHKERADAKSKTK